MAAASQRLFDSANLQPIDAGRNAVEVCGRQVRDVEDMLTLQDARILADQLCTRIMRMVGIERCTVAQISFLADELVRVDSEAQAAARLRVWKGSDYKLSMVMVTTAGHEGWANLILDRRRGRRFIAMLPPPIAATLKEHFPIKDVGGSNN